MSLGGVFPRVFPSLFFFFIRSMKKKKKRVADNLAPKLGNGCGEVFDKRAM